VLLLIAASNVGNLLFVRATVRRKEMALRIALGASSGQLAKQFIIEALLLTGIAAALGTLFAIWGVDLIVGLYHATLPQVGKIGINLNVLFFSFCVAIILGVGLGLALTVHISGEQLQQDLQEAGHRATAGRRNRRIRNGLIIAQVALSLLLLVGAGLLGRSFQQLLAVDPGFSAQSVVAMTISLPEAEGDASRRKLAQFCHQLLVRLQNIPGVSNVGGIDALPMSGDGSNGRFIIEEGGVTVGSMDEFSRKMTALLGTNRIGDAQHRVTTGGYFEAMHIPVLRGRTFEESDGPNNPHVAVISESLARRYFPNADPLGKQIQFGNMDGDLHLLNIVGLVGDVRDKTFEATPQPTVYVNYLQRGSLSDFSFVVRARIEAKALIGVMRRETQAANPEMPIKFETLEQLVASSLDNRRFGMVMVGEFAGTALILAMVGLYGLMAYITTERTTEIGIRMALGAQRRNVLQLILRHALFLFATGTFTGVLLALATTWLLRSFLYGVGPIDLVTYSAVVFLSGITASIATYFPARRAMAVDPMIALRQQ
jgi:putative ABC transport system permease protein